MPQVGRARYAAGKPLLKPPGERATPLAALAALEPPVPLDITSIPSCKRCPSIAQSLSSRSQCAARKPGATSSGLTTPFGTHRGMDLITSEPKDIQHLLASTIGLAQKAGNSLPFPTRLAARPFCYSSVARFQSVVPRKEDTAHPSPRHSILVPCRPSLRTAAALVVFIELPASCSEWTDPHVTPASSPARWDQ